MQFKLTAFYAFGFFEIFGVEDPLKLSCSNVSALINFLQTVLIVNENPDFHQDRIKHSLLNLWH